MRLHHRHRQQEGDAPTDRAPHPAHRPSAATTWPDWRHHAFLTDLDDDAVTVDKFHRQHAVVELAIRDLKEGAGLEHVPSGNFHANSAWLQCAALAHNMIRWTAALGNARVETTRRRPHRPHPTPRHPRPARQPRRTTNTAHPTHWPWANTFTTALDRAPHAASRPRLTTPHGPRTATDTSADNPSTELP